EAAVAHRRCDDLARKWKKKARAFDQHDRLHAVRRHVLDAKDAAKNEFEVEQHRSLRLRLAFEPQRYLDIGLTRRLGVDMDLDVERRLLPGGRERTGRVRVFERQILYVLGEDADL